MAAMGPSSIEHQRNLQGFMTVLSSAACEWVLIFLLFMDATLSYLLTKFAEYCELQSPCLLCSRLDHVFLGDKMLESYCKMLCNNHRSEISSLVYCHTHGKLADIGGLCEDCLVSYATRNKSNSESYRLLVGRLGLDLGYGGSLSTACCSCCGKPWRSRLNTQRLLQNKPFGAGVTKPDIPLPSPVNRNRLNRQNGLKKKRNIISRSRPYNCLGNNGLNPLSHVGYCELEITSDSESEMLLSDGGGGRNPVGGKPDSKEDFTVQRALEMWPKRGPDNVSPVKQSNQSQTPGPLLLDLNSQPDVSEPQNTLSSDVSLWHGLKELNWQQAHLKSNASGLPELISLDVLPTANTVNVSVGPIAEYGAVFKSSNSATADLKVDHTVTDTNQSLLNHLDSSDALKSEVSKKREDAPFPAELHALIDSREIKGGLKPMVSQSSSFLGTNVPSINSNTGVEICANEAPNSSRIQLLQKSDSPRRSESGFESLDESSVCEFEGMSAVDKLKQQIEYDRRCLNALYKELEEERSASAVAANQAMAMITRLQEEKASLHMEALQYLRMMEEQAEYDVEALEKANNLLAEKEKDVQDLEAELEFLRNQLPVELMVESLHEEACNLMTENENMDNTGIHCIGKNTNVLSDSIIGNDPEGHGKPVPERTSSMEFEEERNCISESLKKLEEKLHHASSKNESSVNKLDHGDFVNEADTPGKLLTDKGSPRNGLKEDSTSSVQVQNDSSASDGRVTFPVGDDHSVINNENTTTDSRRQLLYKPSRY